jgi:iron complex outermembrane recepter protein
MRLLNNGFGRTSFLSGFLVFFLSILIINSLSISVAFANGSLVGNVYDQDSKKPLIGANIFVSSLHRGATTGLDGDYEIFLPAGDYAITASYLGYRIKETGFTIVDDQMTKLDFYLAADILKGQTVVVLGTRRKDRTIVDSPVPIDVFTSSEIRATGLTQTTDILQMLVPSLNAPKPAIRDGSDHVRPAMLRGLGPDQVLVLVNGKRRHSSALIHVNGSVGRGSSGVDMNAIPANAIERIEVLRDGAAAQYGSDAIAGVINIVLRKDEGFDFSASYGQSMSTMERGYDDGEGLIAGETYLDEAADSAYFWSGNKEDVTYSDGQTTNLHLGYGKEIFGGKTYVSLQLRNKEVMSRAGLDPRQQYFDDDPREATFDRENFEFGTGQLSDISMFFNSNVPLNENGYMFYLFGGLSYRNGLSGGFFRLANQDRTVREIHPDGFLPRINSKVIDHSYNMGVRGTYKQWAIDISESFGMNSFDFGVENSNNASMGTASPTEFDCGGLFLAQNTINLDLFRSFDFFTASPITFAMGSEFRTETYKITEGEESSYIDGGVAIIGGPDAGGSAPTGAQVFPGFTPNNKQDESRSNIAFYTDLENDITTYWMVGVAGRFENYSDFGSTITGKISSRYQLPFGLAARTAVSTGFRAPSLGQSFFSSVSTQFINGQPFELGTFPVNTEVARALGAKDLEAEKAVNLSAGITLTREKFSVTVDAYQINIAERIVFTEDFKNDEGSTALSDFLAANGLNATGGRYFANALDTKTRGIDLIARYGIEIYRGTLRLTAGTNFTETEVTNKNEVDTPNELQQYTSTPLFGRVEIGRIEKGQPQSTINLMANYDLQNWKCMLRTMRYGSVTDFNSDPARDQEFEAKWLTDMEVSYSINDQLKLSIGSNNIFDVYPDKNYKKNSYNGIMMYSRDSSPTGFAGRYVYTRIDYTL